LQAGNPILFVTGARKGTGKCRFSRSHSTTQNSHAWPNLFLVAVRLASPPRSQHHPYVLFASS
jgi:hypothetical protein